MKYYIYLLLFCFISNLIPSLLVVSADDNYKCAKVSSGDNHLGNKTTNYLIY
jgi:hypothetical protein